MGKQDFEPKLVSQKTVLDSVFLAGAYSLFWAYLLLSFISPSLFLPSVPSILFENTLLAGLGILAFVLLQVFSSKKPFLYRQEKLSFFFWTAALVSLFLPAMNLILAYGYEIPWWILALGWIGWGLSAGFLYPLFGTAWSVIDREHDSRKTSPKLICVSYIGTACLSIAVFFAPLIVSALLLAAYCIGALVLFSAISSRLPQIRGASTESFFEKFNPTVSPKRFFPIVIGATLPIALFFSIITFGALVTLALCSGGCLAAGVVLFVEIHSSKTPMVNELIERFFFPIAAASLFCTSFLPGVLRLIPLFVLLANYIMYCIFHWAFLTAQSHRYSFSTPCHFSLGLRNPAVGLFYGCGVSAIVLFFPEPSAWYQILFFGLTALFVIITSLVPYAADPLFEIDVLNPDITETMDEERLGLWKRKCRALAQRTGLSPREEEF